MLLRDRIVKGPLCGPTAEGVVPWSPEERRSYYGPLKGLVPYSVNAVAEHIYRTKQPRHLLPEFKGRKLNVKPPAKNVFIEHTLSRFGYEAMGLHLQVEPMERAYTLMAENTAESALAITKNTVYAEDPEVQAKIVQALEVYHEEDLEKFKAFVETLDIRSRKVLQSVFDMFDARQPDYVDKMMARATELGAVALVMASAYLLERGSAVGPVINQNWFINEAGFMVINPSTFSTMVKGYEGASQSYYANCEQHLIALYAVLHLMNTGEAEVRWATAAEKKREGSDHRVVVMKGT